MRATVVTLAAVILGLAGAGLLRADDKADIAALLDKGIKSLGGELVNLVKNLIQRERPAQTVAELVLTSYSFPSGHALGSTAVYVTLALLVSRQLARRRGRFLLVGAAVLLAGLIGFSRLYLGVHYLSDVAAGWAGGLGCALLAAWLQDWWAAREESPLR